MSFCASCGRQRNGTERFCAGCGAEFSDTAPVPQQPGQQQPAQQPPAQDAPPVTRFDLDPGMTRVEPPGDPTDPFASWYQQQAPGDRPGGDATWQPTQTVQATPSRAPGYLPPPYPPPAPPPFPPGPPMAPPPTRGGRGRWLFITVAVIVILAAGGGAYALASSLGKHQNAQQPTRPTVSASSPAAPGTTPATSPSASPTGTSPSPVPSPTLSLVAISANVPASTAQPRVEELLSHYFHGINTHDYQEYAATLNPAQRAKQTQSQFESGYSSTSDSAMTLTSLTGSGNGGLTATVAFTSRQSPSQSVDNSSCNAWTLNLYLVPQGSGYLIGPSPAGYQPTYSDC